MIGPSTMGGVNGVPMFTSQLERGTGIRQDGNFSEPEIPTGRMGAWGFQREPGQSRSRLAQLAGLTDSTLRKHQDGLIFLQGVQRVSQRFASAAFAVQWHGTHRVAVKPANRRLPQFFLGQEYDRPGQCYHQGAGVIQGQVVARHQERAKTAASLPCP